MPITITLLFILTMTGMTFVPESIIPMIVWPLMLGGGNLTLVLVHSFRHHALLDDDIAPLLTAVFSFTLAIAMLFEYPWRGISFLIAFVATMLAGVIWSAWRATRKAN